MAGHEEFAQANRRGRLKQAREPKAVSARYEACIDRILVYLDGNIDIAFAPRNAEGLQFAEPGQLENIEISPSGFGIYFPSLDVDLYLPDLMRGMLGSRQWMASCLGSTGGKVRTEAKSEAARANGKLGVDRGS